MNTQTITRNTTNPFEKLIIQEAEKVAVMLREDIRDAGYYIPWLKNGWKFMIADPEEVIAQFQRGEEIPGTILIHIGFGIHPQGALEARKEALEDECSIQVPSAIAVQPIALVPQKEKEDAQELQIDLIIKNSFKMARELSDICWNDPERYGLPNRIRHNKDMRLVMQLLDRGEVETAGMVVSCTQITSIEVEIGGVGTVWHATWDAKDESGTLLVIMH